MQKEVILKAAQEFRVSYSDLAGRARDRRTCRARFALYKAFRLRGASYVQIARWLERDHSTVIHGVRVAEQIICEEPEYKDKVDRISRVTWGGVVA